MRASTMIATAMLALAVGTPVAHAAPAAPIDAMMKTPASAFDMFLFRLYESGKCKLWFGDSLDEPDVCITSLRYDPERDALAIYFRAFATAEMLGDFAEVDDDQREIILTEQIERVASIAGAVGDWGMLHSVAIRHGWSGSDVDEGAFRKALAARTAIHLSVSYGSTVYLTTRDADGGVLVDITKTK